MYSYADREIYVAECKVSLSITVHQRLLTTSIRSF